MNFSPLITIFLITTFFNLLIYLNPFYGIYSTDFGLMMIQVEDIIKSNFSTFSIQYPSINLDPNFEFYPFTKPFLGKVGNFFYIDFPPFYPLLIAIVKNFFGKFSFTVYSSISSFFNLILIYIFLKKLLIKNLYIHIALVLYSFCTTIFTYNFFLHEYPISVFLISLGIYFAYSFMQNMEYKNLILFGLFSAFSLYFRLEMIFIILGTGISILFVHKSNFVKISFFSFVGFLPFFLILLYLNYYIHGHILGLRYVLTITDNPIILFSDRIAIIKELLFGSFRGLFIQSLFFLLIPILAYSTNSSKEKKFLSTLVLISFLCICFTTPNHGDHIAPRYLFGLYPISVILFVYLLEDFFEMNNAIFYKVLICLIFIYSFFHSAKNFIQVKETFVNLNYFNQALKNIDAEVIIFRTYAEPLNAQNIYLEKKVLVADSKEKLIKLVKILKTKNLKYAISAFGKYQDDLPKIKELKLKIQQEKLFYILW